MVVSICQKGEKLAETM